MLRQLASIYSLDGSAATGGGGFHKKNFIVDVTGICTWIVGPEHVGLTGNSASGRPCLCDGEVFDGRMLGKNISHSLLQSITYDVNKLLIHDIRTASPEHIKDIAFHVLLQAVSASSSVFSPSVEIGQHKCCPIRRRIRELCREIRAEQVER
jgi:hypothetical protein